jgi:hypothetical protein
VVVAARARKLNLRRFGVGKSINGSASQHASLIGGLN